MLCTMPKEIVKNRTKIATQKVYHCTPLRLSHHHWESVPGRDSSKISLRITKRSCQNLKFSICRSSALRRPHWISCLSMCGECGSFLNHFAVSLSDCGKRRASVRRVSSIRPGGKSTLIELAQFIPNGLSDAIFNTSSGISKMKHG